jgi:cytochrome P450
VTTGTPIVLDSSGEQLHQQSDRLRAAGPAALVGLPGGLTAWSVSRGDIVKLLLTHPDISKDPRKSWPGYQPGAQPWLTAFVDVASMFTSDGSEHQRLRTLVGRAFTARRVEALRPAIEAIVTDLLDRLDALEAAQPGQVLDLRALFTYAVPTRVICDLFGVPAGQRARMLSTIDALLDTGATPEQAARTGADLFAEMDALIAAKRAHPGEDMTTMLLTAHDGDKLDAYELASTLLLMVGAGSETTVALLGHAIAELLIHPDQRERVLAGPERWDDVIEETLRLHPPVMHLPLRFATADIDLGEGVTIRSGDLVMVSFGAHGRDPHTHDRPEHFDIDRADKQHLAFGHGIHFCLGAPLARLEARVALPALFARFPGLQLAVAPDDLRPQRSFITADVLELPVFLT